MGHADIFPIAIFERSSCLMGLYFTEADIFQKNIFIFAFLLILLYRLSFMFLFMSKDQSLIGRLSVYLKKRVFNHIIQEKVFD